MLAGAGADKRSQRKWKVASMTAKRSSGGLKKEISCLRKPAGNGDSVGEKDTCE